MKAQYLLSAATLLSIFATVAYAANPEAAEKPPAFFLAGDSTTASSESTPEHPASAGGWGGGFLHLLKSPATGQNFGRNGRTTVDFVSGGHWAKVIDAVKSNVGKFDVYVTIQFGHNDQKAVKNLSLDQYQANLVKLAKEIKALGATPILLTPLSRRIFDENGKLVDNLAEQRERTLAAAKESGTTVLNLNQYSAKYLTAVGPKKAHTYNLTPKDFTHLNENGVALFGELVADLLLQELSKLTPWITPNQQLKDELWNAIGK